jgi:nitrite reductase (NO-forming)
MPFFVAAFAAAEPGDARIRIASVAAVAIGALGVVAGVVAAPGSLASAIAGGVFISGVLVTALATLQPLGAALGPSRGIVTQAYIAALGAVVLGAMVGTLMLAGWAPVVEAWARLRPAHAWLNLVGFVSLVIATTLLHFFPTVVAARIARHPSARLTVLGLGGGAIGVAAGYWLALDILVQAGALATLVGAIALVIYAMRTWTTRARWTTDHGWHRFAIGGLGSAIGWFAVGIAILGGRAVAFGAAPAGWSVDPIVAPLVGGWIGLAIVASATHLVPAVGPGDQRAHARQRAILGRATMTRLAAANLGVAMLTAATTLGLPSMVALGIALLGFAFAATAVLLAQAIRIGIAGQPGPSPQAD